MNNLSFRGKWIGMLGRDINININKLQTVWKVSQKFKEERMGNHILPGRQNNSSDLSAEAG